MKDRATLEDAKYNLYAAWAENYLAMYQLSNAIALYRDAFAIRPKVEETKSVYKTLFLYESLKKRLETAELDEKIKLAEKCGDICVKLHQQFHFKRLLIGALSRYTEQLELVKTAIGENNQTNKQDIAAVYVSIAMTYVDLEEIDCAIENYRFAVSESNHIKSKQTRFRSQLTNTFMSEFSVKCFLENL